MIALQHASLSYFLFLCSQLLCVFVCCHVAEVGERHTTVYQHTGMEVDGAWSWTRGQCADAQPAHGMIRKRTRSMF